MQSFFTFSPDHHRMVEDFLRSTNKNTEFEIRFGRFVFTRNSDGRSISRFESSVETDFFYKLKSSLDAQASTGDVSRTLSATDEFIYQNNNGRGNIKRIRDTQTNTDTYMIKNTFNKRDIFDYDIRLSLASERRVEPSTLRDFDANAYMLVRHKQRSSYSMLSCVLDLTIVHEESNGQSVQKYEVELEIRQGANIESIYQILSILFQTRQDNYYVISNQEKRNVVGQYKALTGKYHFVGAQPETLQKNGISNLYKTLYSVTDKADGDRAFLFIDQNKNVYFIDSNIQKVYKTNMVSNQYYSSILDGELIQIDGKIHFMAFDLLFYNSKDLRGDDKYMLKQRLNRLNHIVGTIQENERYHVEMKKYIYKNVFLGSEIILDQTTSKPYKNDGLIFTPMNEPYPTVRKWQNLLKWKPAELNTIDLFSEKVGPKTWSLYVQHKVYQTNQSSRSETVLFDVEKLCSVPVPAGTFTFETTFEDDLIDPTTNEPYQNNTVIEYSWNAEQNKFVPLRTRWDKTANPEKHGNFSSVACSIWNNIHNPVEKDLLLKFTIHDNRDFFFERMRKHHNRVKEYLYNKYCQDTEYLLELCSGRGGDMHKWIYNRVKNVYGYDISDKNVTECVRRLTSMREKVQSSNYNFYKLDLCSTDASNVIFQHNKSGFNAACCHFGIHYFFQSKSAIENIISILDRSLQTNGIFIATFIDDVQLDSIFQRHGNQQVCYSEIDGEIMYYLKRDSHNSAFGRKLRIVLNGNNYLGGGSDEFIIDFPTFRDMMRERGYSIVETQSFDNVPIQHTMQPWECDISHLNRYCVFQKVNDLEETAKIYTPPQDVVFHQPETMLFNFDNIDIQQDGISVCKVNTKYDIVDVVNCIEYKYYKNMSNNKTIATFGDIQDTFDALSMTYRPVFIKDPLDFTEYVEDELNNIYFTHFKYVVEKKKADDDDDETIEVDNWYVITYKDRLLFKQPAPIVVPEKTVLPEQSFQAANDDSITIVDNVLPQGQGMQNAIDDRKALVLDELTSKKVTVTILKDYLKEFNLKSSGKKEDLLHRLIDFCRGRQ